MVVTLLEILVLSLPLRASWELLRTLEMLMFLDSPTGSDGILAILACLRIQTFWWGEIGCTLGITVFLGHALGNVSYCHDNFHPIQMQHQLFSNTWH